MVHIKKKLLKNEKKFKEVSLFLINLKFIAIKIKIPADFLEDFDKLNLKIFLKIFKLWQHWACTVIWQQSE